MNRNDIKIHKNLMQVLPCLLLLSFCPVTFAADSPNTVVLKPKEYSAALRNPLKGFRPRKRDGGHEYGTLCRVYLKWNELERTVDDGVEQIIAVCDKKWRGVEQRNIKVIPRVYLHWDGNKKYWPSDMTEGDYDSDQFKNRLLRLISRLGECWDNDPRVAWVQMGIIGKWGEHHSPGVTPEMQKLLGEAFTKAFRHKRVTIRHPWEFKGYKFGVYWDSWAHIQQMSKHGGGIEKLGTRWHTHPIGGECAYNWGNWRKQPGDDPNDTLRDPKHRAFLINSIRRFHCNNLGWVAEYDASIAAVRSGAEEVQKAFGYRFVMDELTYTGRLYPGSKLSVVFNVRNTGSSPLYANWPVEISLLDPKTRKVVWRDTFKTVDVRKWLPGDRWDSEKQAYHRPPERYSVQDTFQLSQRIKKGKYLLAIAILDPAGMLPSARFAIQNYFKGGRHPLGWVGVGVSVKAPMLDKKIFDDPARDDSLHYIRESRTKASSVRRKPRR